MRDAASGELRAVWASRAKICQAGPVRWRAYRFSDLTHDPVRDNPQIERPKSIGFCGATQDTQKRSAPGAETRRTEHARPSPRRPVRVSLKHLTSRDKAGAAGAYPPHPQITQGNPMREAWVRKYPWGAKVLEPAVGCHGQQLALRGSRGGACAGAMPRPYHLPGSCPDRPPCQHWVP